MGTILVISDNINGFSTNVICNEIERHNVKLMKSSFEDDNLGDYIEFADVLLTVLSDEFDARSLFVSGLKKKCYESSKKIVIYGSVDKVNAMRTIFPDSMIAEELIRPIENLKMIERLMYVMGGGDRKDSQKHILVVDDSGPMLRTIMGWLERQYRVSLANSARKAQDIIDTDMPDLMLLDYEMPICSGPEFLRILRGNEKTKNLPVFFLTSHGESDSVMSVLNLNPQGYILKTVSGSKVLEKLDEFFKGK